MASGPGRCCEGTRCAGSSLRQARGSGSERNTAQGSAERGTHRSTLFAETCRRRLRPPCAAPCGSASEPCAAATAACSRACRSALLCWRAVAQQAVPRLLARSRCGSESRPLPACVSARGLPNRFAAQLWRAVKACSRPQKSAACISGALTGLTGAQEPRLLLQLTTSLSRAMCETETERLSCTCSMQGWLRSGVHWRPLCSTAEKGVSVRL